MKRTFLLALLAAGLLPSASAQTSFGLKAGLNLADLTGFEEADLEGAEKSPRLGLVAGAFAEIPLSGTLSFRPEVLYSQKGTSLTGETVVEPEQNFGGEVEESEISLNLDYIEVPLLAHLTIPAGTGLELGVLAGVAPAFRVGESFSFRVGDDEVEIDTDEDLTKTFDLGIPVGVMVGAGPFAVDLRYTFGVLDIANVDEDDPDAEDVEAARNGVFSVTANYTFGR